MATEAVNPTHSTDLSAVIANSTASKIRTFLYEIAEGTSNYRSLHSLTQQVEHQYHGRFVVELIQNAHDALFQEPGENGARIEIRIDPHEGTHGTLYVANDGHPFSVSNFESLSQLGQSDKNPEQSIGNKGIGFRSVLEICDSPAIYSRKTPASPVFDGLCFQFTPEVISLLKAPINALVQGDAVAISPLGGGSLVDWDEKLLAKLRHSVSTKHSSSLDREMSYLSPYLLPLPLKRDVAPKSVLDFEAAGYATVLRMPLKSSSALELAQNKLTELPSTTVLFLQRVSSLVLDSGSVRRALTRKVYKTTEGSSRFQDIAVKDDAAAFTDAYRLWTRTLRVDEESEEFRKSVSTLPGKWPSLSEARVSIAIKVGAEPDVGLYSVFLPTLLHTGSAVHVNAPFFSDMSRTQIDFKEAYNAGLLETAWSLAADAVRVDLAGRGEMEGQSIVDLLAPNPDDSHNGEAWINGVCRMLKVTDDISLTSEPWFLSQSGWLPLNETSLLPVEAGAMVFTDHAMRTHATFGVFHSCLNSRRRQLELLSKAAGFSANPRRVDIAETAEVIAAALLKSDARTWTAFWNELRALLGNEAEHLTKRKVLLGRDGDLHAAGDDCTVFFAPRRGVGDDAELAGDDGITDIPQSLRAHVAFLHDDIELYDENNRLTATRKYLEDDLVASFRVEDIFRNVLIPRTPSLPVGLRDKESALCADILRWGLQLVGRLVERGIGDTAIQLLKDLPVPCIGGWFRADTASFGPGWPNTRGTVLRRYLKAVGDEDCNAAIKRLLVPPKRPEWGRMSGHIRLLKDAGVFDGLRLKAIEPDTWSSAFLGSSASFAPPHKAPHAFSQDLWDRYREYVRSSARPYYGGEFAYQMPALYAIPGLSRYVELDGHTRIALMELILSSASQWPGSWRTIHCRKVSGSAASVEAKSPLWFALSSLSWMGFGPADNADWRAPRERWHVPAKVLGSRGWQFEHLDPLPAGTAHRLDVDLRLSAILVDLGMPQFDLDTRGGTTLLLNALATAAESEKVRDRNVFLGQIRSAWTAFWPNAGQKFPRSLLVHKGNQLIAMQASSHEPIYIPDSSRALLTSLERFDIPVLAIELRDASRLASQLIGAYGDGVVLTSTLRLIAIADGEEWSSDSASTLQAARFEWAFECALTLAAYSGYQARGTGSSRFQSQVQTLRHARVSRCKSLAARLETAGRQVPHLDVPAMWIPEARSLLISEVCEAEPELLSDALAATLDRDDLILALMVVLKDVGPEPTHERIVRTLSRLRISEAQYLEVREHWRGTLRHVIDLLVPFLTILQPKRNLARLLEATTDQQVIDFVGTFSELRVAPDVLVNLARESANGYDFGYACFRMHGAAMELDRWNRALGLLNQRNLTNLHAAQEFRGHAAQMMPTLRAVLAFVLRQHSTPVAVRELVSDLERTECPGVLSSGRWEVSFKDTLAAFVDVFRRLETSPVVMELFTCASLDSLLQAAQSRSIDTTFDPVEVARRNRERLAHSLRRLLEIGLAWAVNISHSLATSWDGRSEEYSETISTVVTERGYLALWSDIEILTALRGLARDTESQEFWSALDVSNSLNDLASRLGVSEASLASARRQLSELREQALRQRRIVTVCGSEFDSADDNLTDLWSHIEEGVPESSLPELGSINLSEPDTLILPPPRKGTGSGGGGGYVWAPTSKVNERLVGLAGEIHAFRRLQQQHGSMIVSASAWISSNSLQVYSDNTAAVDDSAGCDLRFSVDGRTYHVEVKASGGAEEMFSLGSSEIRLAMELSRSGRRRQKDVFIVLRVLNALSERPLFHVLPNPYDDRYRDRYSIIEAGARVRYHVPGQIAATVPTGAESQTDLQPSS